MRLGRGEWNRSEVLFFVSMRPELLHAFNPQSTEKAFPCPRTWEMVSNIVHRRGGLDPVAERALFRGTVGEAAAVEFSAFLKVWHELPHPRTVIDDPEGAVVPGNASALIALCGSLYRMADDINLGAIVTYATRLRREVGEFLVGSCIRREPALQHTQAFHPVGRRQDPLTPPQETNPMNLTHDAMLVSLRINSWSGRLYDRQASQQVAIHHDADTNAGRYNKRLLPKQAFAALAATMSNARTSHYANTLPWDDQGGRLLTVANYDRYTAALDTLVERVVRERARFIEDYDDYVDQARLDLGRLFRLEDRTIPIQRRFRASSPFATVSSRSPTRATSWPIWPRARPSGSSGTSSNRSGPASTMRSAIFTGAWARRSSVSANACARTRTASPWCSATA